MASVAVLLVSRCVWVIDIDQPTVEKMRAESCNTDRTVQFKDPILFESYGICGLQLFKADVESHDNSSMAQILLPSKSKSTLG